VITALEAKPQIPPARALLEPEEKAEILPVL
jgi:hypothetical protein